MAELVSHATNENMASSRSCSIFYRLFYPFLVLLPCFTLTDAMYYKRFTQELISAWQESFVASAMRPLPTTKVPVLVPSNKTPVVSASVSGSSPRREDTSTRRSTKPLVYFFL